MTTTVPFHQQPVPKTFSDTVNGQDRYPPLPSRRLPLEHRTGRFRIVAGSLRVEHAA